MKRILMGLALIPVLLLCFVLFVLGTESGLRFALWQAEIWAPDTLTVESVEGKLLGPLDITGLVLATEAQQVAIDTLAFRWTPADLFSRQLTLDELTVDGIAVKLGESSQPVQDEPENAFAMPEQLALPVSVLLRNVALTNIRVTASDEAEPVLIESVVVDFHYLRDTDDLTLNAKVLSDLLSAEATLNTVARDQFPIDAQISWLAQVPEFAPLQGSTSLSGTIKELTLNQSVAEPYAMDASVVVSEPLKAVSIAAQVNVAAASIKDIKSDLPAIGITGEFAFDGEPSNGQLQSTLRLEGDLPAPINSTLLASIDSKLITLDALTLNVDEQPLELKVTGTVDVAGAEPLVDLSLRWSELAWPWDEQAQMLSATGSAQITGSPTDTSVSIDSSFNESGTINGVAMLTGKDIDATLNWSAIQWPLDGSVASNISGGIAVGERLDGYILSLNTTLDTPQLSGIVLSANGAGTQQSLQLSSLSLQAADGIIAGDAQLTWAPALSFATSLVGEQFNPEIFVPEFAGDLTMAINAQGQTIEEVLEIELDALTISGVLRDQPLDINAQASVKGTDVTIDTLTLDAGNTSLVAKGTVSDTVNVSFSLDSPSLSELLPNARGSLVGKGRVAGKRLQPLVELELTGRSLSYDNFSLQALDLDTQIDTGPQGPLEIDLSLIKGVLPGLELETFKATSKGRIDAHEIDLNGESNQGDVEISLSGSLVDQIWGYTLETAALSYPSLAPWRLEKPASGVVSQLAQSIVDACLVSDDAQVCTSADFSAGQLQANYSVSEFALATINPFLPEGTRLSGTVDSQGAINMPASSALTADLSATLNSVSIDINNTEGESVRLVSIEPGQVNALISDEGTSVTAQLDLREQGNVELDATIAGSADELLDGTLSGQITGRVDSLKIAEQLVPVLEDVQGRMAINFELGGSPRVPTLDGELALIDGNVALTGPGIIVSDANVSVSADGASRLSVAVAAKSDTGSLRVDGFVDLATLPTPLVDLTVKGDQFQVVNTLEAEAALSPDLSIQFNESGLAVNGEVGVPVLAITPKKVPASVVAVSSDQQVVGEETDGAVAVPVDVRADVRIVLGEDVFIDAFGMNAALAGALAVKEVPGQETTATGQLQIVDGTFKAYGQNLVIEKGNIIYAGGPISKPGFDIDAVRKVTSELQVGIRARGALANPQFSLFSTPPMSESEQMSYLILGRPLQDNSPSENSAMRQAAMALGVAGGKLLTEKFGDKLGLDSVAIGSELRETGEQAALVVGKYLSPRLFVSYGIGLFEPVSTLKLDYTINRNIKLISETTESKSGGDIVFTFEGGQ